MKATIIILSCFFALKTGAQALQDINYSYLYNPNEKFALHITPVHSNKAWVVLYDLRFKTSTDEPLRFVIQWEKRDALNDKQGVRLTEDSLNIHKSEKGIWGSISFSEPEAPRIIVAKVVDNEAKQAWMFYKNILPEYPVNGYLMNSNGQPYLDLFVQNETTFSIGSPANSDRSWIVSYYSDDFPAAAPAFSEGLARVPSIMKVDSTFTLSPSQKTMYDSAGLYLAQTDTSSKEGFAFRSYYDYPKYSRIENLAGPLIYVSTKQEADRLRAAKSDKKSFDRVILSITGDTERAKSFMRSYFRQVELANQYFSSYKEGWKTDRGMIYIIFGMPEEVYKFTDREVWSYKNEVYKVTFDFVRSPTLFDPDNYVLVRNKKFQETWYQVIDLWRNARF
ncbi:MAG TPA: GWxTD domain-containing protein [Cyclobacteriaceae bacterium]|nr:GWxTD domain-containing protein [Cyclobacteriaceae bacterium]